MRKPDKNKTGKPREIKTKNHFRIKILKVLFLVTILPLVIISVNSLYTVIKTRKQNISELQMLAINNAGKEVEKIILFDVLTSLNKDNLSLADVGDYRGLAESINVQIPFATEITMIDRFGYEIYKIPETPLLNTKNKPYFEKAIKGRNFTGKINFEIENPTVQLGAPVLNKTGEIIGIVSITFLIEQITEMIKDIKLGQNGFVYLVDENGRIIASSNNNFSDIGFDLGGNNLIQSVLHNTRHDGMGKNDIYTNRFGDNVIFAGESINFNKIEDGHTTDWFIISEWSEKDAFAVVNDLINRSIIIIFISFIFAAILGLFLVRQVVRPIETLFKGTEQITKGNYNHRVDLKTGDEFEVLGENFNKMIKVLKENARLKEEFVFIAAHELRTPVTAIRGYLDMVLNGTFGEISKDVKESLVTVNKANERLVQLVQDLLQVARSDAGRMEIDMKPVDIRENVTSTIDQLKTLADEKGIKINYTKPPEKILVMADSYKLNEVLTNIIGNSIKYTLGNGSIEIWHKASGSFLATHIKDHGIGMSKEDMAKLFGKFYRIKNDETQNIDGTGLGLYVCKEIINRIDGKLKVVSEKGKGSTFTFFLKTAKSS